MLIPAVLALYQLLLALLSNLNHSTYFIVLHFQKFLIYQDDAFTFEKGASVVLSSLNRSRNEPFWKQACSIVIKWSHGGRMY